MQSILLKTFYGDVITFTYTYFWFIDVSFILEKSIDTSRGKTRYINDA